MTTAIQVPPDELRLAAEAFARASHERRATGQVLDAAMQHLGDTWTGAGQKAFRQAYAEWREREQFLSALLEALSRELQAVAQRYERADR